MNHYDLYYELSSQGMASVLVGIENILKRFCTAEGEIRSDAKSKAKKLKKSLN